MIKSQENKWELDWIKFINSAPQEIKECMIILPKKHKQPEKKENDR
jgi:hypothetical protein